MGKAKATAHQILESARVIDSKRGDDTIRIWEGYKDQAILWRALALIQIPATAIAIIFAVVLWQTRSVTLNVPSKPLPGQYTMDQIGDTEYVEQATELVNLLATYQPTVAKRQFEQAAKMLDGAFLPRFRSEVLQEELSAIVETNRTQVFFMDPSKTLIQRGRNGVHVTIVGTRTKLVANRELPPRVTEFTVSMKTIPRNTLNPYGIVITNVSAINKEN